MPTHHLHLARRGAIYQWRARLPLNLRHALGRAQMVRSLRTADPTVARRRARAISAAIDKLEVRLLNAPVKFRPSKLQLRLVLEAIFNRILAEGEARRDGDPANYARYAEGDQDEAPPIFSSDNTEEWTDEDFQKDADWAQIQMKRPDAVAAYWEGLAQGNITQNVQPILNDAFATFGVTLPQEDPLYDAFARDATRVVARAYSIDEERWKGRYGTDQGMPSFIAQKYPLDSALLRTWTSRLDQEEASFLSQSIDELARAFAKHRQERGISPKTESDDDMARRYFVGLVGNRQVQDLTPSDAEKFANALLRIPREFGKGMYARLTPPQAIKLADDIEAKIANIKDQGETLRIGTRTFTVAQLRRKCERLRKKTANKHLTFFTSLWRSPLVPRSLRVMNPFEGTLYKKGQIDTETARRGTRVPFSGDELKDLFATSIWNGCALPYHEEVARQANLKSWKYWCPIIALYSGLRREEVARLRSDDFDTSNGVWFLKIQATHDRRLKSKASIRDVPVHSKLIELGLRDFVEGIPPKKPLFPELRPTGAYKEYGEQLGKWFRTYRQARDLYSSHTDFHSFRHSFVHSLRDSGVAVDMIALLVGHEYGGITANVYGRQVSINQKKEAIERMALAGVFAPALTKTLNTQSTP